MIHALTLILLCQLAGEVAARGLGLPIPGPVLGLAILLALMSAAPKIAPIVRPTGEGILRHLSLLFVPPVWVLSAISTPWPRPGLAWLLRWSDRLSWQFRLEPWCSSGSRD